MKPSARPFAITISRAPARGRGRPIAPASLRGRFGVGGQLRNPVVPAGGGRRPGGRRQGGGCRPTRRSAVLPEADERERVVVGFAPRGPDLVWVAGSEFCVARWPSFSGNRESPSGRAAPDFGVEPVERRGRSGRSRVLAHSPSRSPALPARGRGRPFAPASLRGRFGVGGQLRNPVVPAGGGRRPGGRRKGGGCRPTRRSAVLPEADERGKSSWGPLGAVRISFRVNGSAFGVARRPATSGNRESPSGRAAPDGTKPSSRPFLVTISRAPGARPRKALRAYLVTRGLRRAWATSKSGRTGRRRPPGGTGRDD